MITKHTLNAAAKKLGANNDAVTIEVSAPDGKQFVASGATVLVGNYWRHAPESKSECFSDLLQRINEGIEDLDHEL